MTPIPCTLGLSMHWSLRRASFTTLSSQTPFRYISATFVGTPVPIASRSVTSWAD